MKWIIHDKSCSPYNLSYKKDLDRFAIASEEGFFREMGTDLLIGIDGFMLPRYQDYDALKHLDQYALAAQLFLAHGKNMIQHLKGIFNLVIIHQTELYLFNDIHSIRKYFIYHQNDEFLITNDLRLIAEKKKLEVNREHAALFCLMEHFIEGITLFKHVSFSKPATCLTLQTEINTETYWLPERLIDTPRSDYSLGDLAEYWKTIARHYVEYLKPGGYTVTLTAGNDSRLILSTLLSLGIKPNAFTFGSPRSVDVVISKKVAATAGIQYHNYFVEHPTPEWFTTYGHKIVDEFSSMLNIHRAHRYDAIEQEMNNYPGTEMICVGDMGGEYIKEGFVYCDYILSKTFRLWEPGNETHNLEVIRTILRERHLDPEKVDLNYLLKTISSFRFMAMKGQHENLMASYYIDASIHHTQDMNIYLSKLKYVFCPFMDVDVMERLFSSRYNKLNKSKKSGFFLIRKLFQFDFHIYTSHALAPELSDVEYGKKGYFTNREYVGNKLLYILKRVSRYFNREKYQSNFALQGWIKDFSVQASANFSPEVKAIMNETSYQQELVNGPHPGTEGHWHNFTHLINIDFIIKRYLEHP